jgi:hypothetical protein
VVADSEGRLHLVQSVVSNSGDKGIKYMVWNGANWHTVDILSVSTDDPAMTFSSLSHCINSDKQLTVIYSMALSADSGEGETVDTLILTSRAAREIAVESPVAVQFSQPTVEPLPTAGISTATPEVLSTETQPAPTPAATLPAAATTAGSTTDQILAFLLGTPWVGIALGLALALVIVILAFSLRMRKMRGHDTYW